MATAKYRATRESGSNPSTYRFEIEFSDDPGSTVLHGCSKERCEMEVQAARDMGYVVYSDVFRAAP